MARESRRHKSGITGGVQTRNQTVSSVLQSWTVVHCELPRQLLRPFCICCPSSHSYPHLPGILHVTCIRSSSLEEHVRAAGLNGGRGTPAEILQLEQRGLSMLCWWGGVVRGTLFSQGFPCCSLLLQGPSLQKCRGRALKINCYFY